MHVVWDARAEDEKLQSSINALSAYTRQLEARIHDLEQAQQQPPTSAPSGQPRPKRADEVRAEFLEHLRVLCDRWSDREGVTDGERCDGLVYDILRLFDGEGGDTWLPGFTLTVVPSVIAIGWRKSRGLNWYEPVAINASIALADEW